MADIGNFYGTIGFKLNKEGLDDAQKALEGTGKKGSWLDNIMSHFVFTFGDVVNVGKKLFSTFMGLIESYGKQELALSGLSNAMKLQGIYTEKAFNENVKYAESLSKITKYADETIEEGMKLLTTFGLHDEQLRKTTQAALDLSVGIGIDLNSAMMLLGKAFQGNTAMLGRYGIKIDENIESSKKFDAVIAQLQGRFGGLAENEGKSVIGTIEKLKVRAGELEEAIGKELLPIFIFWADKIKIVIDYINELIGAQEKESVISTKTAKDKLTILSQERIAQSRIVDGLKTRLEQGSFVNKKELEFEQNKLDTIDKAIKYIAIKAGEEILIAEKVVDTKNKLSLGQVQKAKEDADKLVEYRIKSEDRLLKGIQKASDRYDRQRELENQSLEKGFKGTLETMVEDYQNFGGVFMEFWGGIHASVNAGFVSLLTNLQDGISSFSEALGVIWEGIKKTIINAIAEMLTRWVISHATMIATSLGWKSTEVASSAAVGASRAAAATAWTLWGAIAIGAAIGAAIMAFAKQFAGGVRNFAGGMALVGERGAELVNLPRGANVFTNAETKGALAGIAGDTYNFEIVMHGSDKRYASYVADQIYTKVKRNRKM